MTDISPDVVSVSGSDVLSPSKGDVLVAVSGQVQVFATEPDGRRVPLTSLNPGEALVGCDPTPEGFRMLVCGSPGTRVALRRLDEFLGSDGVAPVHTWVSTIGQSALHGRWVDRVVAPGEGSLTLAPGEYVTTSAEAVASTDQSIQGWLRVTSGVATYCGWGGATVGVFDPPVPITRGVWLTAGLRCRISAAPQPSGAAEWLEALNAVGRLALQSAVSIQRATDESRQARLRLVEARSRRDSQEGLDLLAGAVIGPIVHPAEPADRASSALSAAFIAARAGGLVVHDEARSRAAQDVELGRDPVTAVAEAATARAREVDLAPTWFEVEGPPLVAELRRGGFVALMWHGKSWVAIDPADPTAHVAVDAEYASTLRAKATELVPILPATPTTQADLLRLSLATSRRELVVIGILTLLIAALSFVTPLVFGTIAGSFGDISQRSLLVSLGALLLFLLAGTAWRLMRSLAMLRTRVRSTAIASGAVWDRMMRLRSTWHDGHTIGERMTQSTAVNLAAEGVPDAALLALLDTVAVAGSLAAVATTTPALTLTVAALMAFELLVMYWLVRRGARLTYARVTASAAANGRLMETLRAVNRLKVSGAQGRAFRRWAELHARLTSADLALRRLMTVQTILIGVWPLLGLIAIVAVTSASGASFGQFVTAQTAVGLASVTIAAAALSGSALLNSRAIIDKVQPVLEAVPEGFGDGVNPGILSGGMTVNDVVFRYIPGGPPVLDGVSLRIAPGEHVAIVGPSGCGKTTLMRILLGLEEPESGVIAVDGKDMASLDRPSVRRQIGCVLQSSTLLPGPIRENVSMGRGLVSSEIWEALEAASVADDVRAMGMGLDTPVVDGGGSVSGGQRQRILIARALAGSPRMLILDEATSALDNVTQAVVIEFLENLRLTRIVVAHRLSTIRTADRIIVMAGGKVAQEGTFDELMATPGHFRELAERQMA